MKNLVLQFTFSNIHAENRHERDRVGQATSAFQAMRSLVGIQSNTLRTSAVRWHLKYTLARAVAASDSEASPRAASCAWTVRPVASARSAHAAQSLRWAVERG
jgi:hypothetical protein